MKKHQHHQGFTAVELLVAVSIVAILSVFGGVAFNSAAQKGAMAREVQAAKTLMTAYALYAAENGGSFLPGKDPEAAPVTLENGDVIAGEEIARYPYRLAPYFSFDIEGTILVNKNAVQIEQGGFPDRYYGQTLCPALGLNQSLVGGTYERDRNGAYGPVEPEQVLKSQMEGVSSLLVFASAGYVSSGSKIDGYWAITPPYASTRTAGWGPRVASWTPESSVNSFGNIDPRYSGKAVCAFLDGSVKMLGMKELADMRLWSKCALAEDNPTYTYTSSAGGRR